MLLTASFQETALQVLGPGPQGGIASMLGLHLTKKAAAAGTNVKLRERILESESEDDIEAGLQPGDSEDQIITQPDQSHRPFS